MVYRLSGVASLALLLYALYSTVRLAYADWLFVKGDAASIQQAIRLAPGTAEYYSTLAQAEPANAVPVLEEAIAWTPRDASLLMELGLAEEERGDFSRAEAYLLEAMRLDTGFAPRWALSDFYFHRRDAAKFWPATKAALAVSYGDVSDQFRNCWALTADSQMIVDRAIPDRPAVWRKYLDFLLTEGRLEAAVPVAGKVLASADREAVPLLLRYCDRMLANWRGGEALVVWNGLAARKLALDPGHGFDRQIATPEGIQAEHAPDGLLLRFSGKQPEDIELVSQYVPLSPRRRYALTTRYRFSGGAESGLFCKLLLADGRDLLGGHELRPDLAFEAPGDATLGRLVLGYRRTPGTTRIEGSLLIQEFGLTLRDGQ
jgi:tetratricopeptide (TPR) repeat protein